MIHSERHNMNNRGVKRLKEANKVQGTTLRRLPAGHMLRTPESRDEHGSVVQLRVQRVHLVLCRAFHLRLT